MGGDLRGWWGVWFGGGEEGEGGLGKKEKGEGIVAYRSGCRG